LTPTVILPTPVAYSAVAPLSFTGENGFVTATKLGTANNFFVATTKNFAAATKNFAAATKSFAATTKRFVDRTHFVVVTKYLCYPYFNK